MVATPTNPCLFWWVLLVVFLDSSGRRVGHGEFVGHRNAETNNNGMCGTHRKPPKRGHLRVVLIADSVDWTRSIQPFVFVHNALHDVSSVTNPNVGSIKE